MLVEAANTLPATEKTKQTNQTNKQKTAGIGGNQFS